MKAIDFQLLFELRAVLVSERLMPIALMRIFRARGWVIEGETRLDVEACISEASDRISECDSTMVSFRLTRAGFREMVNFDNLLDNDVVRATLDPESREILDEELDEDEEEAA